MKQMHVWVSGFVQGVGYRVFTRKQARKRLFTGWVKNLPDGRVEAIVQSENEQELRAFIPVLEKGSYFAQVKAVVVEWEVPSEMFAEFTILR